MEYQLSKEELDRLRKLAQQQTEIASLPVMEQRKKLWNDMNNAVPGAKPPFAIESWTFDRDFMPDNILHCKTDYGRMLERNFLRAIRHHEILNDDHVCPDSIDIGWHVTRNEFGIEIPTTYEKDSEGVVTGYHFECPITDLKDGFDMVKPTTFSLDREGTLQEKAFLEKNFGDIMPVAIKSGTFGNNCLTQRLMRLMSMETMFLAMYDAPDNLHAIMSLMRDNAIRISKWAEDEGLLVLNNGNQCTCGTCYNFTDLLPCPDFDPAHIRLKDMWGAMDSQETVGVSPELFHEFFFPYYRDLAEMFGLVYWGCCEPAHPIWEKSLSNLPNLKAVSISRWCNQEFMAEVLSNTGIVFSRKPDPNILGVSVELNEEIWAEEIRTTLEIVADKNIPFEFVVRDVYSMHGNLKKAARAVEIAKQEIDKFY